MATLVRQKKTYYLDAAGRRVPAGTPGAKKVTEASAKWYGQGIPGQPKAKRVPLATDKRVAQRMLDDLVRRAERGVTDLPDADLHRAALSALADDFEADVELGLASKTRSRRKPDRKQVALVVQRVRDALVGCGLKVVGDLNDAAPAKLARHLNGRVEKPRNDGGLSHQSATFVLAAVKRFLWWLAAIKRCPVRADLFDAVPGFDPKNERVHARRECTPVELATILDATLTSTRPFKKMSGPDRYALYLTAFATGFRAGELASLTPAHFDLASDPPAVALAGRIAKNKKAARQPLPPAVAVQLARHLADKPVGDRIWPGAWYRHGARMLRQDLATAKVPYVVEVNGEKKYLDFHGLRHSFVSALASAGVGPRELQELARHSDPRLTLGVYSHARPHQLAGAVGKLPVPGEWGAGSPFAHLTRDQLECALAVVIAVFQCQFSPAVTPRVTPGVETGGDVEGRIGTNRTIGA